MNTEKKKAAGRCITGILWFFSIFIFINAFNFQHNTPEGWYRQFLPDIGNALILEIDFLDSLNGYVRTGSNSLGVSYLLKTTTGGENWTIARLDSHSSSSGLMKFLNKDSGFIVVNRTIPSASDLFRTTDGGTTWDSLRRPATFFTYNGISVLSLNEIWIVCTSIFTGAVWRSLDGGQSWQRMLAPLATNNPDRIYMVNSRIGFVSDGNDIHSYLKKTTDGGMSWNTVSGGKGWDDIFFRDSLVGWKAYVFDILKTVDGGFDWDTIHLSRPFVIGVSPETQVTKFQVLSNSLIWGVGEGGYVFPNLEIRAVLIRSIYNENSWGYQIPDTSYRTGGLRYISFPDSLNGWSFSRENSNFGIHTVTGGDSITNPIMIINGLSDLPEKGFELFQNFPNPFNPSTTIRFDVRTSGNVSLKVYDVLGREVEVMVNEYLKSGSYSVQFGRDNLPSGVYYYELRAESFSETKRMLLVK